MKRKYSLLACLPVLALSLSGANAFAQQSPGSHNTSEPQHDALVRSDSASDSSQTVVSNLQLAQTTITTAGILLTTSSVSPVQGFNPTSLVCPASHPAGCTMRVEISTTVSGVTPGAVAEASLVIQGPGQPLFPNNVIDLDPLNNSSDLGSSHTVQFMKKGIPAGSTQTPVISFQTFNGSSGVGFRVATIQMFLN